MIEGKLNTKVGENVAVFPTDDVGIIFQKVTKEGVTTVEKPETLPAEVSELPGVKQYYKIETKRTIYSGKITIRIIYDCAATLKEEERLQLWQWNKQWKNISTYSNKKYHLMVGETDHLSMFGVT